MAVHANSVISTRINLWDSVLYTKITDMEEYCYDSSNKNAADGTPNVPPYAGVTEYSTAFSNMSTAIIGWMDRDHTATMDDVMGIMNGYLALNTMYGLDMTPLDAINEIDVYLMGGMRATIKGHAVSAWDDWNGVSANAIAADDSTIDGSGISASPSTTTLVANMQEASKEPAVDDIPIKAVPDKTAQAIYLYDTLGFKEAYENLVMTTKIPASYYWNGAILFSDDAETFFGWKDFNNGGGIQQSTTQTHTGTYSLYKSSGIDGGSPDISYKILPVPVSIPDLANGFRIEADVYKPTAAASSVTGLGIADININGYSLYIDQSGGADQVSINIDKRVAGVASSLATAVVVPVSGELLDTWFKIQFDIYNNGSLIFTLKNGAGTTLGTVSVVDTTYELMQVFVYGGDSNQYVDNITTSLIA